MKTSMKKSPHASSGFTLIELMVTIAVLAIIVSIAAPNISTQLANSRVKSTTVTLVNALKEARAESLIRRQTTKVTFASSPITIVSVNADGTKKEGISTYGYDSKSTIGAVDADDDDVTTIEFKANKTADERVFTICDSDTAASPYQVTVSKVGQVSTVRGGSCND